MPTENVNGFTACHKWHMSTSSSEVRMFKDCDERKPHSFFWHFSHVFPMRHLNIIEELTNIELIKKGRPATSKQELFKFFGICLLLPRMPDVPRRDLWGPRPKTAYGVAADLGRTKMSRNRFDHLLLCIR